MIHSHSRILLAGFVLVCLVIASVTQAQIQLPTTVYLKRVDGGQNLVAKSATISKSGEFTFTSIPEGKYELVLAGSQEYFTAKAADTKNIIEVNNFRLGSTSTGTQKTLINTTKSNIRHNGAMAPGGSGADTIGTTNITTSRSNIKHCPCSCPISANNLTSSNVSGNTVTTAVLIKDIEIGSPTSLSGTISKLALSTSGGR